MRLVHPPARADAILVLGAPALAVLIFMGVAMLTANAMVWFTGVRP